MRSLVLASIQPNTIGDVLNFLTKRIDCNWVLFCTHTDVPVNTIAPGWGPNSVSRKLFILLAAGIATTAAIARVSAVSAHTAEYGMRRIELSGVRDQLLLSAVCAPLRSTGVPDVDARTHCEAKHGHRSFSRRLPAARWPTTARHWRTSIALRVPT